MAETRYILPTPGVDLDVYKPNSTYQKVVDPVGVGNQWTPSDPATIDHTPHDPNDSSYVPVINEWHPGEPDIGSGWDVVGSRPPEPEPEPTVVDRVTEGLKNTASSLLASLNQPVDLAQTIKTRNEKTGIQNIYKSIFGSRIINPNSQYIQNPLDRQNDYTQTVPVTHPNWVEDARRNGFTDEDIQIAYDAWVADMAKMPSHMKAHAARARDEASGYYMDDPSRFLSSHTRGRLLDSLTNVGNTFGAGVGATGIGLSQAIGNASETINPNWSLKERIDDSIAGNVAINRAMENNAFRQNGGLAADVVYGLGTNTPAMLMGAVGGNAASLATMAASAYGNESQNLLNQGYDIRTANARALAGAGVEVATELLGTDYIPAFGKSLGLKDILGEGFEEVESALVEPLLDYLFLGDEQALDEYVKFFRGDLSYLSNVAYQGAVGAATGAVGGMSNASGTIQNIRQDVDNINNYIGSGGLNQSLQNITNRIADPFGARTNQTGMTDAANVYRDVKMRLADVLGSEANRNSTDPNIRALADIAHDYEQNELKTQLDIAETQQAMGDPSAEAVANGIRANLDSPVEQQATESNAAENASNAVTEAVQVEQAKKPDVKVAKRVDPDLIRMFHGESNDTAYSVGREESQAIERMRRANEALEKIPEGGDTKTAINEAVNAAEDAVGTPLSTEEQQFVDTTIDEITKQVLGENAAQTIEFAEGQELATPKVETVAPSVEQASTTAVVLPTETPTATTKTAPKTTTETTSETTAQERRYPTAESLDTHIIRTFHALLKNEKVPDSVKKLINNAIATRDPSIRAQTIHDATVLDSAQTTYQKIGLEGMYADAVALSQEDSTGQSRLTRGDYTYQERINTQYATHKAEELYDSLLKASEKASEAERADYVNPIKEAKTMYERLSRVAARMNSDSGRGLRASYIIYGMTTDAKVATLQEAVDDLNRKIESTSTGKKWIQEGTWEANKIDLSKLTNEKGENLLEKFREANGDAKAQADIVDEIETVVANKVPHTLGEQLNQWRYVCMLFNPRTHIRNIVGNTIMQGMVSAKNVTAKYVEKALIQRHVLKNNLDTSSDVDMARREYATNYFKSEENVANEALNQYREAVKNGEFTDTESAKEKFLKDKGFEGKLLKTLVKTAENGQFMLTSNSMSKIADRTTITFANALKEAGIENVGGNLQDASGAKATTAEVAKAMSTAYSEALDKWAEQADIQHQNRKLINDRATRAKAAQLYEDFNVEGVVKDTSKYQIERGILQKRDPFAKGKVLNAISKANASALSKEDIWFSKPRFEREVIGQLQSQGYDFEKVDDNWILSRDGKTLSASDSKTVLSRLVDNAVNEALESTYHDMSRVAQAINRFAETNKATRFMVGAIMPFVTTPINIASRAVEYSPIGLTTSVAKGLSGLENGSIGVDQFVNGISKGLTGTAIAAIGMALAKAGFLTGRDDEDKDIKKYKQDVYGYQDYALHVGDKYLSLGWAAPTATAILLGAQLWGTLDKLSEDGRLELNGEDALDIGLDLLGTLGDPLVETSFLSGLSDALDSDGKLSGFFKGLITTYAGQFTPSLGGAISKVIDETARSTYSTSPIQQIKNTTLQRLGMSRALEAQLDGNGNEKLNAGGEDPWARAFNAFINPGTLTVDTHTEADDAKLKLYEETGGQVNPLGKQQYYFTQDGERFNLDGADKTEFNKTYLGELDSAFRELYDTGKYQNLDSKTRDTMISSLGKYAYAEAKKKYFDKVALPGDDPYSVMTDEQAACSKLSEDGILTPAQYYYYKSIPAMEDDTGNKISGSGYMIARMQMEAAGVYDDIVKAYKDGIVDNISSLGLSEKVVKMTPEQYDYEYERLLNGYWDATTAKTPEERRADLFLSVEENQQVEDAFTGFGVNAQNLYSARDAEGIKGEDGTQITYTQDILAREALGADNFDKIRQAIIDGELNLNDAVKFTGIGKTVFKMTDEEFEKDLKAVKDGTWTKDNYTKIYNKKAVWWRKEYDRDDVKSILESDETKRQQELAKKNNGGTASNGTSTSTRRGTGRTANTGKKNTGKKNTGKKTTTQKKTATKTGGRKSSSRSSGSSGSSSLALYNKLMGKARDASATSKQLLNSLNRQYGSDTQALYNRIMKSHEANIQKLRKELNL